MRITVYITSYNQAAYLPTAIESVLTQTRPPDELLIVDDASDDASPAIIQQYQAQYPDLIRTVFKPQNGGVARARNTALEHATSDYVTYLDSDDTYLPEKIEREAAMLTDADPTKSHFVFSDYYHIDADGEQLSRWAQNDTPPTGDILSSIFRYDFPNRHMFRYELAPRRLLLDIGGYDPQLRIYEDDDLRIRLAASATAHYCDVPLSEYRSHNDNISAAKAELHFEMLSLIFEKNHQLISHYSTELQERIIHDFNEIRRFYGKQAVQNILNQPSISLRDRWHMLHLVRRLRQLEPRYSYFRLLKDVLTPF